MTSLKAKTANVHTSYIIILHSYTELYTAQLTVFRTDGLLSFAGLSRSLLLGQNDNHLLFFNNDSFFHLLAKAFLSVQL